MTYRRLLLAVILVLVGLSPTLAAAGVGDIHFITGPITMWGANRFDQQMAVVQDDEGRKWLVRFSPSTLPRGAAIGTEVSVLGRETAFTNELEALGAMISSTVSALPAGAASAWAVVPGSVQDATGMTAVMRANGGAVVTVDLSQLDASARTWVSPGRAVTVVGVYRPDGVLAARGVATSSP